MDFSLFLLFSVTTAVIIFSPGPTAILMASQGAGNGLRRGLFGVFGVCCATVIYFTLSALGITSLIVASNTLFSIIKWAGVAYLVYLGATAVFGKSGGLIVKSKTPTRSLKSLFTHGFIIECSNPKAWLYFSAVVPQFLNLGSPILPQFIAMWVATFVLQLLIYGGYTYLGTRLVREGVKDWIVTTINKTAGLALLFAAFKMALS